MRGLLTAAPARPVAEGDTTERAGDPHQTAASAPYDAEVDVEVDDDPLPELAEPLPEPVGMFGQWWPVVVLAEPLPDDELPLEELDDPDVVVVVLAVVVAWFPVDGFAELAPAANMPRPRLSPAAPATAATAITGCFSFITCPFSVSFRSDLSARTDSERPRVRRPPWNSCEEAKNCPRPQRTRRSRPSTRRARPRTRSLTEVHRTRPPGP